MHLHAVIALGLAAAALAQASETSGRIEGEVVDVRGEPVAKARVGVVVEGNECAHTTCDAEGFFVLGQLPLADVVVIAGAAGYRSKRHYVELERRREVRIRLCLLEAFPVHGRVTDGDGKLLPNALVVFYAPEKFVGREQADHAWTDAEGRYLLPSVPVGPVIMTVVASGYDAQNVTLEVTGEATQDLRLQRGETADYLIAVTGASEAQWEQIRCQIRSKFASSNYGRWDLGELWPRQREVDTLIFSGLPANLGIVEFVVSVPNGSTKPRWLAASVGKGGHAMRTSVVADSHEQTTPAVVKGSVRDPGGRPLAGLHLKQWRSKAPPDVAVTGDDGAFSLSTVVSASGFFSLELDDDDYVIHRKDSYSHSAIIHAGSYFAKGPVSGAHAITADRAASVAGSVVDCEGAPVFGAEVRLLADDNEHETQVAGSLPDSCFASATTARDGSFAMRRLDSHLGFTLWLRITSPRGIHAHGPLSIAPGKNVQLGTVKLPRPCVIEGTIVDGAGGPRAGIRVSLFRDRTLPHTEDYWTSYTDRRGRYRFAGLPAGKYRVKIDSPHARRAEWPDFGTATLREGGRAVIGR